MSLVTYFDYVDIQGGSYRAIEIAKYVIDKCTEDECPVSNLQLQKILYYIQREFLQIGRQAFPEEIEAWQFGPVVPEVYQRYCGFAAIPIRLRYKTNLSQQDMLIINPIVERKRVLEPWDIVRDVHATGKAWDIVYNNGKGNHCVIPKNLIKEKGAT